MPGVVAQRSVPGGIATVPAAGESEVGYVTCSSAPSTSAPKPGNTTTPPPKPRWRVDGKGQLLVPGQGPALADRAETSPGPCGRSLNGSARRCQRLRGLVADLPYRRCAVPPRRALSLRRRARRAIPPRSARGDGAAPQRRGRRMRRRPGAGGRCPPCCPLTEVDHRDVIGLGEAVYRTHVAVADLAERRGRRDRIPPLPAQELAHPAHGLQFRHVCL
jgi:hypothetical protein